jgi:hypothetical protein
MDYLLSYPRSGNTWVRFLIEWFSGKPTSGITGPDARYADRSMYLRENFKEALNHVSGEFIIEKAHTNNQVKDEGGKLLLLIRNPKEAIIRHENSLRGPAINGYMSLLETYHNWDEDRRKIIYYEDLITNPKETINEMLIFLGISTEKLPSFMENYDHHFNLSVKSYGAGSKTGGVKLVHHSKKMNNKENNNFRKMIDGSHQHLKTYIERFI